MDLRKVYPKRVGPTTLTTSAAVMFTADKRYGIEQFMFTNYSAAAVDVTAYVVTSGGSPGDSNTFLGSIEVSANDQTSISFPIILEVGEKIYALASAGSAINMTFNVDDVEIGAK